MRSSSTTMLSKTGEDSIAFVSSGDTYHFASRRRPHQDRQRLDVAVQGDGWLAIQTPPGVAYTRDGRMRMMENGELHNPQRLCSARRRRRADQLDPTAGTPKIARDGMITQNGAAARRDRSLQHRSVGPPRPLREFRRACLPARRPKFSTFPPTALFRVSSEESNVNPVLEMSRLIAVTARLRSGEFGDRHHRIPPRSEAIRTLGETS